MAFSSIEYDTRHQSSDIPLKKEYLDTHASEIETLTLGNSHAQNGLNPKCIDQHTYNTAYGSRTVKSEIIKN